MDNMKMTAQRISLIILVSFVLVSTFNVGPLGNNVVEAATQATFYASPTGSGSICSQAAPCSLTGARDLVRTVNSDMTGDIIVYLTDGTYNISSTISFGTSDSGTNGYNILYKAYPGAVPVISGGTSLTGGWTLHNAGNNIWKKTGVSGSFRQLYVNDNWGIRARYPDLTDKNTDAGYLTGSLLYPFKTNSSNIGSWANNGVTEFVWVGHWSQNRGRIDSYTVNGSLATIYFKTPESAFALNHHNQSPTYYYFENAYELLDAEGEWFLDTPSQTLYYKPRVGESMATAEVIAPSVEKLINITGTPINPVHNIQFYGLTFKHDNWITPNNYGFIGIQSGNKIQTSAYWGNIYNPSTGGNNSNNGDFSPASAMFCLKYANNIRVERNIFTLGGSWGVMEFEGTDHNTYIGNNFNLLALGAIVIGNSSDTTARVNVPSGSGAYDLISNNLVDSVGYYYRDAVGILLLQSKYVTIEHNEIRNLAYTGISVGLDFTDVGIQDSQNNIVRYNRIHNVMSLLDDGGGIYTLGKMDNSSFDQNYIYNIIRSPYNDKNYPIASLYLDNGSNNKIVDYNVSDTTPWVTNASNPPNYNNIGRFNYYNNDTVGKIDGYLSWADNVSSLGAAWPTAATNIMINAGIESAYSDIGTISRGANLAVAGTASASTQYDASTSASKANDNDNYSGLWASDAIGLNPWWQVDLGSTYRISEVAILARQDLNQSSSRKNFAIRASNTSDFSTYTELDSVGDTEAFSNKGVYSKVLNNNSSFRYVRIQRINSTGHFNFAEVKVYGYDPNAPAPSPAPVLTPPAPTAPGATSSSTIYTNVALNKTTTASSYNSSAESPDKAVDGLTDTKWYATGTGPYWLTVDLGQSYTIGRWLLRNAHSNRESPQYNTKDYKLQKSDNGIDFIDVDAVTGNTFDITSRNITNASARYWRLYITAPEQGTGTSARIYEFGLYTRSIVARQGTDVALGKLAAASSYYGAGNEPSKGNDGVSGTLWASDGIETNPWWQVDLASAYKISNIELVARQDINQGFTRTNFEIRASNTSDFSTYTSLATKDGSSFPAYGTWSSSVADTNAYRYIAVQRINNAGHMNFSEFKVFEAIGGPTDYLAKWGFDQSREDFSGHGFDAVLYGSPTYNSTAAGRKDGSASLSLNGSSQYASSALVSTLTNNVTLTAWVNWNGGASNQPIVYNGNSGANGYGIFINNSNGNKLSILCGGVAWVNSNFVLTAGQWTQLTAVRRNGIWELYVNGNSQILTNNTATPNVPAGNTFIGGPTSFNGLMDDVRIYGRALSQQEIQELTSMISQAATLPSDNGEDTKVAAYWPFDEGSGTVANDVAIGDKVTDNGTSNAAWVTDGVIGNALKFNGSNKVTVDNSSELNITRNLSVSIWFKLDKGISQQTAAFPLFFHDQNFTTQNGYLLFANKAANTLNFRILNGTTNNDAKFSASGLSIGQWYHLTGTYDGSNINIYLDGVLKNTQVFTGSIGVTANNYEIGTNFEGSLDEARIYNCTLSDVEVKGIYKGVKNPWRDNIKLFQTPAVQWIDSTGPDYSLKYDNTEYNGSMARVFAYYSVPAGLQPGQKVPAIVLIHGGAGTAYQQWAQQWASYGYAAIAMDLNGFDQNGTLMSDGRPWDSGNYNITDSYINDSWHYHAAAAAIRAVSFLRSRNEVDPNNIAAMGISWGSFTLNNVISLDNRIKAAVPVYGCGYLMDNSVWQDSGKIFSQTWINNLDPSNYLSNATASLYWVSGNNDDFFPPDSYKKSYNLTKGNTKIRIKTNMTHDYNTPWNDTPEIRKFVDSNLKSGTSLIKITAMGYSESTMWANYETSTGISSAKLVYTTDTNWKENYGINNGHTTITWTEATATIDTIAKKVSATVPSTAVMFYLNLYDSNGSLVSTQYVENVALNKTASASSVYNMSGYYNANKANDGSNSSG